METKQSQFYIVFPSKFQFYLIHYLWANSLQYFSEMQTNTYQSLDMCGLFKCLPNCYSYEVLLTLYKGSHY